MQLQILEIVLWPTGFSAPPRRLKFTEGKVNVITGASRTGKSAVIPIIDYCLGSANCSIPVDTIRNACSWFGVIIKTSSGQILLGRREPGQQRATDDMFILQASTIEAVPAEIQKNSTVNFVKRLLDELSGLSNLETNAETTGSGFEGRPSFRDMVAFNFQPQNVVANPDILFYKTSTYEHREKLREIFPYVLGAINADILAKQHELANIRSELKRKQRELAIAQNVSAQWEADALSHLSEARELGLLSAEELELNRELVIERLRQIAVTPIREPKLTYTTIHTALEELRGLENEELDVSMQLTMARRRLDEMQKARSSVSAYAEARTIQRERLQVSNWLVQLSSTDHECPMCGHSMEELDKTLLELSSATASLEANAGVNSEIPAAFDRELSRVGSEASLLTERLQSIQIRKVALERRSKEVQGEQYTIRSMERFIGRVQNALKLHDSLGEDGALSIDVEELLSREAVLAKEVQEANINSRKRRALDQIDLLAGRLIANLDAEFPNAPIRLNTDDLTVRVIRNERQDLLSEIGSGSNWLSYHLATMLALHEFFLQATLSPVPSFLILDQPSQVYFPKRLISRPNDPDDEELRDEDVEAVQKAFKVLAEVVLNMKGKLQIIVLDHAPHMVWGNINGIESVEEWRNGQKLVPVEWLED